MENKETIGHFLQKGREKQKISLEEVANKTKISISILRSLEANELDSLPNKTYVKGFVQNYTKCIGLDQEKAYHALEKTYHANDPTLEAEESHAEPTNTSLNLEQYEIKDKLIAFVHSTFEKKTIVTIISICAVIVVIKLVISFFSQISNEQKKMVHNSDAEKSTIKSADKSLFDLESTKKLLPAKEEEIQKDTKLAESPKEVEKAVVSKPALPPIENVSEPEVVEEEQKPTPPTATTADGKYPFIKFTTAPSQLYRALPNATENNNEELIPTNIKESMLPGKANVFINAYKEDTWISYKVDQEDIKRYVLKQGRSLFLKGDVILLFLGNVHATAIFYNNELIEVDSKTGVKSLVFPQELARNYMLPLFPTYNGAPMDGEEYRANMAEESP